MDNKNQNKLNSKDLEQDALSALSALDMYKNQDDKADAPKNESKEKTETEKVQRDKTDKKPLEKENSDKPHNETNPVDTADFNEESGDNPEKNSEEKDREDAENQQEEKASQKKLSDNEEKKGKNEESSENDSTWEENERTREDVEREDEEIREELKNLITNAIENKKILRKSDTKEDKKSSTEKKEKVSEKSKSEKPSKTKAKPIAMDNLEDDVSFHEEEEPDEPKAKKGFFSRFKKTKITIIVFVSVIVLLVLFVVGMFLKYMGLLNRNADNSKNYSSMPVDDSEIVGGDDTFDRAKKEAELKAMLEKNAKPISDSDVTNILLIGEDVRNPDETGRGNTDVMMIISINQKNKTITLTSLLRDAWVYLEEFGVSNKLNAAYWHGGTDYLEKIVENYYGIEIDRFVSVNFQSFIDVVDAVGGLDFNVAKNEAEAMKDPLDEVNDILGRKRGTGYVKAGKQHLDGYQSLAYARIRYNCGDDYGRTQRQRAVISQIIKKSKKLDLIEINDLLNKVLKKVTTDITTAEAGKMALDSFSYMSYSIQQLQMPAAGYFKEGVMNGLAVLEPDYPGNMEILKKVVYGTAKNADEAIKQMQQSSGS